MHVYKQEFLIQNPPVAGSSRGLATLHCRYKYFFLLQVKLLAGQAFGESK